MPCNSDHLEPDDHEKESMRLMALINEVKLLKVEVPYYGKPQYIGRHTAMLCEFCQNNDVSQYSLELQIWWRDHQKADMERLEREQQEIKIKAKKKAALDKLTYYEKGLLGL